MTALAYPTPSPARHRAFWPAAWRAVLMPAALALSLLAGGCANMPASALLAQTASAPAAAVEGNALDIFVEEQLVAQGPGALSTLPPTADLWERIRRGFAMPDLQTDLVHERQQWYASRPDYIQRMTERSSKYLYHIVEELERRNMPTELALLPFVESAFNPRAVSSAKAAGMWQFMPQTGRHYALKQNIFRDDRRDVLASTRAALDYLQKLYTQFGHWHLALAAYNWGEGNVGRAIAKNQAAGLPTDYADLTMPGETRHYVPKLQAIKNIVASPVQFSCTLPSIQNHPYFRAVRITRDMDVSVAAELAEMDVNDFKALNPSMHKPVILAAGTPQVLLPWDNATLFQKNLQARGNQKLASWTAWTVPGLMRVPDAAKRFGMNEREFRNLNSIPPGMLLQTGATLLVPRSDRMSEDVSSQVADNAQMAVTPEVVSVRKTVYAQKGDTVARLASRYALAARDVMRWNDEGSTRARLKKGEPVTIYRQQRVKVPPLK